MIIRGGENIAPAEIENVISSDSRVSEVKVIGVPDPHYIEEICACVVHNNGQIITDEDIRQLVRETLAYYKVPRYVLFFDELPHTPSGKIALGILKEAVQGRLGKHDKSETVNAVFCFKISNIDAWYQRCKPLRKVLHTTFLGFVVPEP